MSAGVVVVAGIFPEGSVVTLTKVANEAVQRSEGGEEVGRRQVDADSNVGWDGLEIGASYLVDGYVDGYPVTVRAKATDVAEQSNDLSQAPTPPPPVTIGTQQAPEPVVLPEPPATELPVGVPDGVSISQVGAVTYYLHIGEGDQIAAEWHDTGLQAPAHEPAEGDTIPARPLFSWTGEGDPDLQIAEDGKAEWEAYEGPTEPAGTSPADSVHTSPAPEPTSEAATPVEAQQPTDWPEDVPIPPQPHPDNVPVELPAPAETPPADVQPPADAPAAPPAGAPVDVPADSPAQPASDAPPPVADVPPATEPVPTVVTDEATAAAVAPESQPAAEAPAPPGGAEAEASPSTSAPADQAASPDAASTSARDQLAAQAEGLGIANTADLSESDLRSAISDHGGTPVA